MATDSGQQRLHKLAGTQFYILYTNLALPPGNPLITRVMSHFLKQQDILELEAKANGNSLKLSQEALQRMGQRRGVTLAQLLAVLRNISESRLLLSLLGVTDLPPAQPAVLPQPQQLASIFQSRRPVDDLILCEGDTAEFSVTLREPYRESTVLSWHKGLAIQVECNGTILRMKDVKISDQGQYRCCAQLHQQSPSAPRPFVLFNLKVRTRRPVPIPKRGPLQPPPLPAPQLHPQKPVRPALQDMQRTHKYALIVSCQAYTGQRIAQLGHSSTDDLDRLRDHLTDLGYRAIVLLNVRRAELLSAVERLCCMLTATVARSEDVGLAPHLFLLLDGHGTVIQTPHGATTSCFLPSDAIQDQPATYLRVEEELLQPLANCLPARKGALPGLASVPSDSNDGLLVAVFDMCRSLAGSTVASAGSSHMGASVQDGRIQRLHATSYASMAATLLDKNQRQSFGVTALNKCLEEDKCHEERLNPKAFLNRVSDTICQMSQRYHNQSPELQVCHTRARLSDMVFLNSPYSCESADRLIGCVRPAWRKFALLIGAGDYRRHCDLGDLQCVPGELHEVQGALQLLGYHTVVCCDPPGGRSAVLAVLADFCRLVRFAAAKSSDDGDAETEPVQVVLLVDGHGELSLKDDGAEARSLFLISGGDGGNGYESIDIEMELARPLFDAVIGGGGGAGRRDALPVAACPLLLGFYDTCRSYTNARDTATGLTPSVRTFESPDYYRFFTASICQQALANLSSGSMGVRALLDSLRKAAYDWKGLQPSSLLHEVANRVREHSHNEAAGRTQFPVCMASPSKTSLAELDAYRIGDERVRLRLESAVWQLRFKHGLLRWQ